MTISDSFTIGAYRSKWIPPELSEDELRIIKEFHKLYYKYLHLRTGDSRDDRDSWLGYRILKCPLDLFTYQEILLDTKPDIIVETGTFHGGSALYLATLCQLLGRGRVITVDLRPTPGLVMPDHPLIEYRHGYSQDPAVVEGIKETIKAGERVMVILDSDHHKEHVLQELALYTPIVSAGCYTIVEDSNFNGHPILPEVGPGPMEAIEEFIAQSDDFRIDRSREKHFLTFNPSGYLLRVNAPGGTADEIDPTPVKSQSKNASAPGYHDVDLVKENGTYVFYFVNDGLYTRLPKGAKHQDPRAILVDIKQGLFPASACTATSIEKIVSSRHIIEAVCQWLWNRAARFAIFDVGSPAGRFAIEIGNYVRYCGKRVPIVAFEPGRTCDLVRYSVELNGLGSQIDVREFALSDVDGPLLFAESDAETNASSLWRRSYHDRTTVVRSVSLETALAWVPDVDHMIMKLDVEGAEPLVLSEIARLRPRYKIISICEIVPWRFGGWPGAADFLRGLSVDYHLINIHSFLYDYNFKIILDDDISPLMQDVSTRAAGFTDMLLIPRGLSGAEELVAWLGRLRSVS